jgi:hypothetical protein
MSQLQLDFDLLLAPVRAFLVQAADFVPRLILALVVILVGWLLAKAARFAIAKGLRAINFQVLTQRAGLDGFLRDGGIGLDTTDIIALVIYWLVILGALVVGFNSLGLVYVTDVLGRVILFVPSPEGMRRGSTSARGRALGSAHAARAWRRRHPPARAPRAHAARPRRGAGTASPGRRHAADRCGSRS